MARSLLSQLPQGVARKLVRCFRSDGMLDDRRFLRTLRRSGADVADPAAEPALMKLVREVYDVHAGYAPAPRLDLCLN